MDPDSQPPGSDTAGGTDLRREALIASLRSRFAEAARSGDAEAKKALFKEAVYLGIQPDLFGDVPSDRDPAAP